MVSVRLTTCVAVGALAVRVVSSANPVESGFLGLLRLPPPPTIPPMPPPHPPVEEYCTKAELVQECDNNDTGISSVWLWTLTVRLAVTKTLGCNPVGCILEDSYSTICPVTCKQCTISATCQDNGTDADVFWNSGVLNFTNVTDALTCKALQNMENENSAFPLADLLDACCPRTTGSCGGTSWVWTALEISVGLVVGFVAICCLCCYRQKKKIRRDFSEGPSLLSVGTHAEASSLDCAPRKSPLVLETLRGVAEKRKAQLAVARESPNRQGGSRTPADENNSGSGMRAPQNLLSQSDARQSVGSSMMGNTASMLTEGFFNQAKLYGIMKLGVYEHWMIKPQDIRVTSPMLGQGAFGMVQRGLLYGGTDIAVKTALNVNQEQGLLSLANEMRLLRRIRHPNIVLFYGVMIDQETMQLSLVLEWVDGANFEQYTNKAAKKQQDRDGVEVIYGRRIMTDVARAMQYLHAHQPMILHRDLKPSNILVETESEPPRAKIADFGISVLVKGDGRTERAGTLEYMAPEVQRCELYSAGADVWSFGCIALFAWAGQHPSAEVYEALCSDLLGSSDVQALALVARCCLQPQPLDRPPVSAILKRLQNADWPLDLSND